MNIKSAAPLLKPLDLPHRVVPVARFRPSVPVRCQTTQPGYYLIGLRLRLQQHLQRRVRPLPKMP